MITQEPKCQTRLQELYRISIRHHSVQKIHLIQDLVGLRKVQQKRYMHQYAKVLNERSLDLISWLVNRLYITHY